MNGNTVVLQRINLHRILPALQREQVNKDMVPFLLPNIILIAEQCSKEEYIEHVLPKLKPVLGMKEPVQVSPYLANDVSPTTSSAVDAGL